MKCTENILQLTTSGLVTSLEFIAIGGPTYDNLPPFQWTKSDFKDVPHVGQPDLWKFSPIIHKWKRRIWNRFSREDALFV